MNLKTRKQNILDCLEADYILHVANCQTTMGSGVAKALRDRWPEVYEADVRFSSSLKPIEKMGKYSFADVENLSDCGRKKSQTVVNLYAQLQYFGFNEECVSGKRYINYEAFYRCLERVSDYLFHKKSTYKNLAIPYKMGSDRAGGDWNIILAMVEAAFKEHEGIIYVCRL